MSVEVLKFRHFLPLFSVKTVFYRLPARCLGVFFVPQAEFRIGEVSFRRFSFNFAAIRPYKRLFLALFFPKFSSFPLEYSRNSWL